MFTARAVSDFSGERSEFAALYKHQFQISIAEAREITNSIY